MMKRKSGDDQAEAPLPFKLQLTVIRSHKSKSVLYLECGKDLIDILLDVLTKPLRELLKLLGDAGLSSDMKNGVFNLYANVSTMDSSTLSVDKKVLLGPSDVTFQNCFLLQYPKCQRTGCPNLATRDSVCCNDCQLMHIYKCAKCEMNATSPESDKSCVFCWNSFRDSQKFRYTIEAKPVRSNVSSYSQSVPYHSKGGFAIENVKYMVNEDLSISRSGALNSLVLKQLENFGELEASAISIGEEEILLLVRATLISKTPLTDVFWPLCDVKSENSECRQIG